MKDPLLPDDPAASQAPVTSAPAAANDDRLSRLEAAMGELAQTVRDAANRVASIQAPPAPAAREPGDFLTDLANDPQGVIQRVARETFQRAADENLNPAVLQVLDTASRQLVDGHRFTVDQKFGIGTFDELFKPQIEKDMLQLRSANPRATADPATVEALVNRLYGGDNFEKLEERRRNLETAHARGLTHLIPAGGIPRLRAPLADELPTDVEQFLRDVERSTGELIDRKQYAKLYYSGHESGPGRHRTSVLDYLKAVGASPDTIKMYGGERQTGG